jgi:hypothetical protein
MTEAPRRAAHCDVTGCEATEMRVWSIGRDAEGHIVERTWCSPEHWKLTGDVPPPGDPWGPCRCMKYRPGAICCAYRTRRRRADERGEE